MAEACAACKPSRLAVSVERSASAVGRRGAALVPPPSGIGFVDRASAPAAGRSRDEQAQGLPPRLRSGIEALSGLAMDRVRVHRDSPQPQRIDAAAFAQGQDIHLGPGQERHLPHEAWHVVQQAQGRVPPAQRTRTGIPVNEDPALEREANTMGAKAQSVQRAGLARSDEEDLPSARTTAADAAAPGGSSTAFKLVDIPRGGEELAQDEVEAPRAEGGVAQRVGQVPTVFPSFLRIVLSPTVQFQMHKAWIETLASCTKRGRREQGFWITWNSRWGTFSTTGATTGPVVGPADGATINLPAKPADAHPTYTVASFHTHTPTTYRTVGRAVGPSSADRNADTTDNVAGIVYDFWGDGSGHLPAGRSRAWPARLYKSRNRRT